MSMITEFVKRLRKHADTFEKSGLSVDEIVKDYRESADIIEELSAKLQSANMERSSQYYNGGWIPVSERLPEQYEEFIVTDIETSDTYQSRYIDEFPNIDELVYKVINRVPIIDRYVNQEINRVLDKIRAEIEARLCDVVSDYTDGYRTAIQGDLAIIDKYQTQRYTLQTVPEKTSVEFVLAESDNKEGMEPHECNTCKFGRNYENGYDATTMNDECGGCCSWNDKWQPKEDKELDFLPHKKIPVNLTITKISEHEMKGDAENDD